MHWPHASWHIVASFSTSQLLSPNTVIMHQLLSSEGNVEIWLLLRLFFFTCTIAAHKLTGLCDTAPWPSTSAGWQRWWCRCSLIVCWKRTDSFDGGHRRQKSNGMNAFGKDPTTVPTSRVSLSTQWYGEHGSLPMSHVGGGSGMHSWKESSSVVSIARLYLRFSTWSALTLA